MDELLNKLNKLLASSFSMYLKTHMFHWNVTGQDFFQYHNFFGELYGDLYASVDQTAEEIRALGSMAPGSLTQFKEMSIVTDQMTVPSVQEMISILSVDNNLILGILQEVHETASRLNQYGLINYIEGRMDTHKKHGWMLNASKQTSMPVAVAVPPVAEAEAHEEPSVEEQITEDVKIYTLNFETNK